VLTKAVLAKKFFVEIPGNKFTVLASVNNVLNVLTPWPNIIELAPIDKTVLILLNGSGKIFDKELIADIVVLNEDVPSELKNVNVEPL
jgi:hypothetical protein